MVLITDESSGESTDYGSPQSNQFSHSGDSLVQQFGSAASSALGAAAFAKGGSAIANELKSLAPNSAIWQDVVQFGPVLGPLKHWIFD